MKILICDDQEAFTTMLNNDLTSAGHEVVIANNGWDGLVEFGNKNFDVAILDIDMPILNGLDLVRIITSAKNEIANKTKLIICTSNDGEWNRAVAWANNALATIAKPYKLPHLLDLIGS